MLSESLEPRFVKEARPMSYATQDTTRLWSRSPSIILKASWGDGEARSARGFSIIKAKVGCELKNPNFANSFAFCTTPAMNSKLNRTQPNSNRTQASSNNGKSLAFCWIPAVSSKLKRTQTDSDCAKSMAFLKFHAMNSELKRSPSPQLYLRRL